MSLDLTRNIATASGILGCAWWAGTTTSFSMFMVPSLLESSPDPITALRTWASLYERGSATGPKVALTSFLALTYSAYDRYARGAGAGTARCGWVPLLVAGVLNISIVPFTLGVMMPTNNALKAGARGKEGKDGEQLSWGQTRDLLGKWQLLNFVRGLFPLAAAGVAVWALTVGA